MNCKSVEDLLWSLCEGSLGEDSARSVEEHLAICRGCNRARDRVQSTLAAMRGVGEIEPSADFQARLWQRIDAWETRRRVFWVTVWAGFIARNRRLLATSGVAFAVALLGGLYAMKSMVGPDHRVAKESASSYEGVGLTEARSPSVAQNDVRQDFVLREIPYSDPVLTVTDKDGQDTVYVHFPTRDLTPPRGVVGNNFVYQPVVTPVSEGEPIF